MPYQPTVEIGLLYCRLPNLGSGCICFDGLIKMMVKASMRRMKYRSRLDFEVDEGGGGGSCADRAVGAVDDSWWF